MVNDRPNSTLVMEYLISGKVLIGAFFFVLVGAGTTPCFGEYRAYSLEIENSEKGSTRQVLSTLDHLQYPTYYPLAQNEVIRYVDSWRCYGDTSFFKKVCEKPEPQEQPEENRLPANTP